MAEDDRFLAKAYEAKLEKSGYEVIIARDGVEALAELDKKKPGLILLDLVMPNKNGFEVLEAIKGDASLKSIPVIILSNLGQDADVKRGMDLGATEYLVKSEYSLQQIVDLIQKKLG